MRIIDVKATLTLTPINRAGYPWGKEDVPGVRVEVMVEKGEGILAERKVFGQQMMFAGPDEARSRFRQVMELITRCIEEKLQEEDPTRLHKDYPYMKG